VALIMVGQGGENIIAVAPGANGRLTPADVQAAEAAIAQADCLLLQLEIPLESVAAAAGLARRHGVRVILNPAPALPLSPDIIRLADILTPNEREAALLAGVAPESPASLDELAAKLAVAGLVVTLGAKGAWYRSAGRSGSVPAFAVEPVDTTAAGDAFNGALAVGLARGEALEQAIRRANAAGAIAASRPGAQPSLATAAEVERMMAATGSGREAADG
jgi:ribokinase